MAGGPPRPCHTRLRHRSRGRRIRPRKDVSLPSPRLTSHSPTPDEATKCVRNADPREPASSSSSLDSPGAAPYTWHETLVSHPHSASHWCCGGSRLPHRKPDNHPLSGFLHAQHITHRPLGWLWLVMAFARRHPAGNTRSLEAYPTPRTWSAPGQRTGAPGERVRSVCRACPTHPAPPARGRARGSPLRRPR